MILKHLLKIDDDVTLSYTVVSLNISVGKHYQSLVIWTECLSFLDWSLHVMLSNVQWSPSSFLSLSNLSVNKTKKWINASFSIYRFNKLKHILWCIHVLLIWMVTCEEIQIISYFDDRGNSLPLVYVFCYSETIE